MMKSDVFMVVGGGLGQIPAILSAKSMGFRVLVIDRDVNAKGMAIADFPFMLDVVDIDNAIELARQYCVAGVITMQSDIGVPTVGAIVDALCLPGNGRAIADRCSNKVETRQYLKMAGVPQPKFFVIADAKDAVKACDNIGYPCIIKASDSSGSRGVVKVSAKKDVQIAFDEAIKFSRNGQVLVEEFISGRELGAQAFSLNGQCIMVLPHDDALSAPPYMIPIGHSFPCLLSETIRREVEFAIRSCVETLGIACGPSNIDIILDRDEKPRIIEVGARMGATCLPELVYHYTGIDWVKEAVKAAAGFPPDLTITREQPCAAYILEAPADGALQQVEIPAAVRGHKDLLELEVTVNPGDKMSKLRKGTDRIGKIVVKSHTGNEAAALAQSLRREVCFHVNQEL